MNAIPAAGVGLTLVLLALAWPRFSSATPRLRGDSARLVLAALLAVAVIPYIFAEVGFYAPDPLLADEPSPNEDIAAVHLGSHEGMDGALLAFAALALSRLTPWLTNRPLAAMSSALVSDKPNDDRGKLDAAAPRYAGLLRERRDSNPRPPA